MSEQLAFVTPRLELPRERALLLLGHLVGRDLRALAPLYGVTVDRDGQRNKGWAGHVVERYLGLPPDALQRPDFGDWELKVVPFFERTPGRGDGTGDATVVPKETMAITMFTEQTLERQTFEESHLWEKLRRLLVVARLYTGPEEARSLVLGVAPFHLELDGGDALVAELRADYEEVRWVARTQGMAALTGRIGRWVQPRPKGEGHGRGGHGFYARKSLISHIFGLSADAAEEAD